MPELGAGVLSAGIEFIVWLQQHQTPALDRFFRVFTDFGGVYYLYLFPLLLWSVDYRLALRAMAIFAPTLVVNTTLKEWIGQPRPFQLDSRIVSDGEAGYGLPSGHAQLVVVFWGVIAQRVARPGFWALAVAIMFLMGFSRVYLGVHFPSDVLAGWALGGLTLWAWILYAPAAEAWLGARRLAEQVGLALAAGVATFALSAAVGDPDHLNDGAAGFVAGAGAGAAWALHRLRFDAGGAWWRRGLRFLVGMAITLPLLGAFRAWGVPEGGTGRLVVALDLALLGFWITGAAPWLFVRLRLGGEGRARARPVRASPAAR